MFTNKEPIDKFKEGCKAIYIAEHLVAALCKELEAVPPSMTYEKLPYPFSLIQLRDFLSEIEDIMDVTVYSNFSRALSEVSLSQILKKTPTVQEKAKNVDPTTHAAAVLTLIEIMAGCSKLGIGGEEFSDVIPKSKELAEKLFKDLAFAERVYSLWKRCKGQKKYYDYMVPFMFASVILLPKNKNEYKNTNDKRAQLRNCLPNTFDDYQKIQEHNFGNCLTQAAIKAKETYYKFFFKCQGAQDNYDMFSQQFSDEEIVELILNIRNTVRVKMRERIEKGEEQHRSLALRWYNSPLWEMSMPKNDNHITNCSKAETSMSLK